MKLINSPGDFEAVLREERAVVFFFFAWSRRAGKSRGMVERWEQELTVASDNAGFAIHELWPDERPETWKWLDANLGLNEEGEQGNGAVVWLKKGSVVAYVGDAADAGTKTLSRITNDCFVRGKVFDVSTNAAFQGEPAPFDVELLKILCCPETHQELKLAESPVLENLNLQIAAGRVQNRGGQNLREKIDGGLVRADGRFLYPLQQNIPLLLVDEAIPLGR